MFKKEEFHGDTIETIIGPSVQVEGNFVASGDVVIEGTVSGSVKTEKSLRIGANAKIFANVIAENAFIAGEVQGNIKIGGSLELTETARVFGDVKTATISIAQGAIIHGRCVVGPEKKSRFEKIEEKEKSSRPKEKPELLATKVQ